MLAKDTRITASIIKAFSTAQYELHQAASASSFSGKTIGVHLHQTDLSSDSLLDLFTSVQPDLVISCVSGGSFETQKCIIDSATSAKVPRFIPAEFAHDTLNAAIQARLPPYKERARTIQYLEQLSAAHRLSWLALSTGYCLDHALHSGSLGFDLTWTSATMHGSGDESFAACSQTWYGHVVLAAVRNWDLLRDRYLYVPGLISSASGIVTALENATGAKWDVGRGDVDECVREAERRIARGFPDAAMFLMERTIMYDPSLGAVWPYQDQDAKVQLGLEAERLEDVVRAALHQHEHHGKGGCGCD